MKERTYYVGEGPEAKALIDAAFAKVTAFREAGYSLLAGMPEGAMVLAENGGAGNVIGFGIPKEVTAEQAAELGISPDKSYPNEDGEFIQGYKPNGRSTMGKELRKRMNAVNKQQTTFSDEIVKTLKINRWVCFGSRMLMTSAGAKGEKLFVSIPGEPGDNNGNTHGGDKFPTIPEWLRAPQGDEYEFFLK